MLVVLGLPAPRPRWSAALIGVLALGFSLMTTTAWILHEVNDLSGLSTALAAVSRPTSVLGLSFKSRSSTIRGTPFLQTFAYFQAEHGGELNFSFAEHGTGVVVYRDGRKTHWTPGLEWFPRRVTREDLAQFECALVNADDATHAGFPERSQLVPRTHEGCFRLYCQP
jgi:hypothetical protein